MFVKGIGLRIIFLVCLAEGATITISGSSQYVLPGQKFTFTCIFTSNSSAAQKELYKNGFRHRAIQTSNDNNASEICYDVTLNITICDPTYCSCTKQGDTVIAKWTLYSITDRSSKWFCKEFNNYSSILSLKTAVPVGFVALEGESGSTINVVAGNMSTLTCVTGQSRPRSYVQWFIGIDNFTTQSISTVINGTDGMTSTKSILRFTPTKKQNNLVVNCTAYNTGPSMVELNKTLTLNVHYSPIPLPLQPQTVFHTINENQRLGPIKCFADCNPKCSYKWVGPGSSIIDGQTLQINSTKKDQSGNYTCSVSNFLESITSGTVVVKVYYAANVTSMRINGNNFSINEHSTQTVICNAEGLPIPKITLRYDNNNSVISETTGLRLQYSFSPARCEDTGRYKCEAVNVFPPLSPIMKNISVLCYPRPVYLPDKDRNIAYGYGETLNISTVFLAYPKPRFKWYFKSKATMNTSELINGSDNFQISNMFEYDSEVFRHISYIFKKSLGKRDFGVYLISASNEVRNSYLNFTVVVQENSDSKSDKRLAFGAGFGSVAIVIILVIIITFFLRRKKSHQSKAADTKMWAKSSPTSQQCGKNNEDEMRINELYVSAELNFVKQGTAEKKSNGCSENTPDIYSVVQKHKKKEAKSQFDAVKKTKNIDYKDGQEGRLAKDEQVFKNLHGSETNEGSNKQIGKRENNGLVYVDLDLQYSKEDNGSFVIRGFENRTNYVDIDIDFTKRAEPLPSDSILKRTNED